MQHPVQAPEEFKYTKDHEWAKIDGSDTQFVVTVGITNHAQSALGDVVFVELPPVGRILKQGETFGVVESIKAVSDLYSPIAGKVIEVNSSVIDDPGKINRFPYGEGWLIRLERIDSTSTSTLLSAEEYRKYVGSSATPSGK